MSEDRRDLERELSRHLADAAPVPAHDSLTRLRARLADTPQRTGPMVGLAEAFRSVGWTRVAAVAGVAAVALVVGVYIGQVGLPIQVGPSSSSSADADPSATPGNPEAWVEPDAYSYVLDSTCGERMLIGRFRITVAGGVVKDAESLLDPPTLPVALAEVPTLGDLLAELEEAQRSGAFVATLVSGPVDGHPVEIMIDHDEQAVDDEACYRISEYRPAGEESPSPQPSTPAPPMTFAVWERFDMPDPAPGVFGGGTPSSVVAFDGGYIAVGTILTECCAEADPAANVGVVWTSTNGRDWQLVDVGDTFEHATLSQVLTDGSRLLALGASADPIEVGPTNAPIPAAWVSEDGREWQRIVGPAPTAALASGDGFVGVASQPIRRAGRQIVRFMTSADGLEWHEVAADEVERVVGLAATPDGRLLVVAIERGTSQAGGSDASEIVAWRSDDGTSWEGPTVVARDASASPAIGLAAATAWREGFVVVGQRDDPARGTIGLAWTSRDGRGWDEHEIGSADGETLTGVFAVGQAVVAVGDAVTSGATTDIMAWVSEDGERWARVPEQPAFQGINNHVQAAIDTPDGLLAVGRRWDPETSHPVPQAWIASDDPMVWQLPTSPPGAEVGDETPFAMGHCGLRSPVDFDGSLWAPMDRDPWDLEFDSATGTIALLEPDRARFVSDAGDSVTLARLDGAAAYPLCG